MRSPAFQFYPDDFLGGKAGLMTPEEVGVYVLLLCLDWSQNGFTFRSQDEQKRVAIWCKIRKPRLLKLWETLQHCFVERDGRMYNPRLEIERAKQAQYSASMAENGRKGGRPPQSRGLAAVKPETKPPESTPSPSPVLTTSTTTQTPPRSTAHVELALDAPARNGNGASQARPAPGSALVPVSEILANGKVSRPGMVRALAAMPEVGAATARRLSRDQYRGGLAGFVFSYWAARTGHPRALLDRKREARIRSRLEEAGDDPRDLLYAIDGSLRDDHLMGRTASSGGRKWDGIETVLRDRGQVERLAALVPAWGQGAPHPKQAEIPAFEAS